MSNIIKEEIKVVEAVIGNEKVNSVNARSLYLELGYKEVNFSRWMKKELIRFKEGVDYILTIPKRIVKTQGGNNPKKDYNITLDVAKHLAMKSDTDYGFKIREYFIKVEKVARNTLGDRRLNLELKKLETEERILQESIIDVRIARVKMLQEMGVNFDPTTLINSGKCKAILDKDTSEALTNAYSDIRTNTRTYSGTYLLKQSGVEIRTLEWNDYLIDLGIVESYIYKERRYKRFVKGINYYGHNKHSSSIKEMPYQMLYYEDRFLELVQLMRKEGYSI